MHRKTETVLMAADNKTAVEVENSQNRILYLISSPPPPHLPPPPSKRPPTTITTTTKLNKASNISTT